MKCTFCAVSNKHCGGLEMRYFIIYLRTTNLHLHTRKPNDTFISRMYMNYYDDICDNPHKPLTNNKAM